MRKLACLAVVTLFALGCDMQSKPPMNASKKVDSAHSGDTAKTNVAGTSNADTANKVTVSNPTGSDTTKRDNTAVNERDRSDNVKTPIDQNENQKDVDITADIRRRVVDTKMSVSAQNVKIITQDGKVTLRGPVATEEEKDRIARMAVEVAGDGHVDNQIEVQP